MIQTDRSEKLDTEVQQVLDVLAEYRRTHLNAQIDACRRNPVSIRIRIIDPDFRGMSWVDREPEVWKLLEKLPEDVFANITMLLLLTPEETKNSFANMEFENPIPSSI